MTCQGCHRLASGGSPDPRRAVAACCGEEGAVRAERHHVHSHGVDGQCGQHCVGGGVPDPHRAVAAARGEEGAVGAERHRIHGPAVAGQPMQHPSGGGIPDPRSAIVAAGGENRAVRAERRGQHWPAVAGEHAHRLTGCGVPDPCRAVAACCSQAGAVRAECHSEHPIGVAGQRVDRLSSCRIPNPHGAVVAARGQAGAIRAERDRTHPVVETRQAAYQGAVEQVRGKPAIDEGGCAWGERVDGPVGGAGDPAAQDGVEGVERDGGRQKVCGSAQLSGQGAGGSANAVKIAPRRGGPALVQPSAYPPEALREGLRLGATPGVQEVLYEVVQEVAVGDLPPRHLTVVCPRERGGNGIEEGCIGGYEPRGVQFAAQVVANHIVEGDSPAGHASVNAEQRQISHLLAQRACCGLVEAARRVPQRHHQLDRHTLVCGEDAQFGEALRSVLGLQERCGGLNAGAYRSIAAVWIVEIEGDVRVLGCRPFGPELLQERTCDGGAVGPGSGLLGDELVREAQ